MAATNLQANWSAVSFPTSGTTLTKINDVHFAIGGSIDTYSADADKFDTVAVAFMTRPTARVTTGNPAQFMGIAPGTSGTLQATHNDAKGATLGAINYSLANAIFETAETNGPHASWGTCQASFKSISTDGTTNPLSFTRS